MKLVEKLKEKYASFQTAEGITVACLGDSVTQGCFECCIDGNGNVNTVFDQSKAYHAYLREMLGTLYPAVPISIINAGLSGGGAPQGAARLERDVLRHAPDLVIVCFGLNDSGGGLAGLDRYENALREIFEKTLASGAECIFMTPNMMNTRVDKNLAEPKIREIAEVIMKRQLDGVLDAYVERAKKTAADCGVPVCDCYAKWKRLEAAGVDITLLLANRINHPIPEMNKLFASSLLEMILA